MANAEVSEAEREKAIKGWCLYDWANSTFSTSVVVAILPVYFVFLFQQANGTETSILGIKVTASSMWAWGVTFASIVVAIISPGLGIIADRVPIKMLLMRIFTAIGAGATVLFGATLFFSYNWAWIWVWILFLVANLGFMAATSVYNSLLPHLGNDDEMDRISSRGFAWGYIGGGLLLVIHLLMVTVIVDEAGSTQSWVVPFCLASAGAWWWGFAILTFRWIPEPEIENQMEPMGVMDATKLAVSELKTTLSEIGRFRTLVFYLVAYLLFIDGVNTVVNLAGVFGADELGVALTFNMLVILLIQFTAAPAAMLFATIAERTSTKAALTATLIGWCLVIFAAVGFAPLELDAHEEHDIQLDWDNSTSNYTVSILDSGRVALGQSSQDQVLRGAHGDILPLNENGDFNTSATGSANETEAAMLLAEIHDTRWSVALRGGPIDSTNGSCPLFQANVPSTSHPADCRILGTEHPTHLGDGAVDVIPTTMRSWIWSPLGLSINLQWLVLGLLGGLMMGGSQALARSMFGMMIPETRSTEFFGFFGFTQKVAAVTGPLMYGIIVAVLDARTAILSITLLIVIGTAMLTRVDVGKGIQDAKDEDERRRGLASESE